MKGLLERAMRIDKYKNYGYAFYTAAVLAVVARLCELAAKRSRVPGQAST